MTDYTDMPSWTLEKLAQMIAADSNTIQKGIAMAEMYRRQMLFQQQAAEAQQAAAEYTKRNACYMLWSVIVLALSSIANLLITAAPLLAR